MRRDELLRATIFVIVVGSVYALAALALVRMALERLGWKARPTSRWGVRLRRVILAAAALGLVCIGYGYFEPYRLEVVRVRLSTPKLPKGARPIRVVQISDFHSDPEPRLEELLPDVIAAEKPDFIVFTGDAANSDEGLPVFRRSLVRIAAVAPTYVVIGNWDYARADKAYAGTGARVLRGESLRAAEGIWVAGLASGDEVMLGAALASIPPGAFTILLYHYPDLMAEASRRKVDLYLAGHTHGGQVALPWIGALVTLSRAGPRYARGLHVIDGMRLYVNRGIGMEGGPAPRVRFWSRPEVTVFEIGPEEQAMGHRP